LLLQAEHLFSNKHIHCVQVFQDNILVFSQEIVQNEGGFSEEYLFLDQ